MTGLVIISLAAITILFLGLYKANKMILPVAIVGLIATVLLTISDWNKSHYYFNQMVLMDNYAIAFISLTAIITILTLLLSVNYFEKISSNVAEYVALILFSFTGVIAVISYQNLAMLFIGIEVMSICMYILAGIRKKDTISNEASLKYFLMGSFATGFLLFGIALVYGLTGSFNVDQIGDAVRLSNNMVSPVFYVGVLMILVGMGFKVAAVPFHFWTPDVYEGSPTLITLYMSSVVKTAAFAAFLRLFYNCFLPLSNFLIPTLWVMSVFTIIVGNVSAVYQKNVKRMLAYSSISHAGYMMIAILTMGISSSSAIFIYAIAYSIASVMAFGVLIKIKEQQGNDSFDAFNGLGKRNPFLAFVMTAAMCSLAGIPLTAGFFGKFFIFSNALSENYIWLVVIAVINAVIGISYYFRVIIAMYMKSEDNVQPSITLNVYYKVVLMIALCATILLGVFPNLVASIL